MISASGKRTLDCTGLMRASLGYAGIIFPSVYPGKGNFAKKASSHGFKYIGKGNQVTTKPGDIATRPKGSGKISGHYMIIIGNNTTSEKEQPVINTSSAKTEYFVSYSSNKSDLITSKKILTIIEDWSLLNQYYPNQCSKYLANIQSKKDIDIMLAVKEYEKMLNIMISHLNKDYDPIEEQTYLYFLNNKNGLLNKKIINDRLIELYDYYIIQVSNIDDWLSLYNDLCLKKYALEYYLESKNSYTSILTTKGYINGIYSDINIFYNNNLGFIYNQIENYVNNIKFINTENNLDIINKQIANYQNQISSLEKILQENYPKIIQINKEINNYQNIYNNLLETKKSFKNNNFSDIYSYWNKDIIREPNLLKFWLEFSNSNEMENYVVQNVGRKAYSNSNNNITSIYYREVPAIIYYDSETINKTKTGYIYLKINNITTMFSESRQGISAKNEIDDLLYKHTYCAEELTLTTVPIHYLEPNTRILIYNENASINGEYIVSKISNPISYNGTMTINATKVTERLY